MVSHLCEL